MSVEVETTINVVRVVEEPKRTIRPSVRGGVVVDTQPVGVLVQPNPIQVVLGRGAPGPPGRDGSDGQDGQPGGAVNVFEFVQAVPATTWLVVHNFGRHPSSIWVWDSADTQVLGDIQYIDANQFQIVFSAPFSGRVEVVNS